MAGPRFLAIALFPLLLCSLVRAADRFVVADFASGLDPAGVPPGWKLKEKSGKADFAVVKDGDLHALHLKSANTSFSLQKEINVDVGQYPVLSWKWKVTGLPAGGDFRKAGTDDQAAQLFIAFSRTKAIVYVWDTSAPGGMMGDAVGVWPMDIKVVVVRSGPAETAKWISETRNVREDYKKLYGAEPPPAQGIRLQINSQHTGTSAESFFADVVFGRQQAH